MPPRLVQLAPLQRATPLEHLVRVNIVGTSHEHHTRTGLHVSSAMRRFSDTIRYRRTGRTTPGPSATPRDGIVRLAPRLMPEANSGCLPMSGSVQSCFSFNANANSQRLLYNLVLSTSQLCRPCRTSPGAPGFASHSASR